MLSNYSYEARLKQRMKQLRWQKFHLDPWLLLSLITLSVIGLLILYSASNEHYTLVNKQFLSFVMGFILMFVFAQITPQTYRNWALFLYILASFLLLTVLFFGKVDLGAKRWLAFGLFRFQPSEMMMVAMPLMISWFLSQTSLPPNNRALFISVLLILIPSALVAKQPDLGTAIIIALSGSFVLLLSGIRWRFIGFLIALFAGLSPIIWHFMHAYQKNRVLIFLNPERDPLGHGYHIIQSKIAIGSGGLLGKGWLNGTQSHLSFLPEHSTDFIFAVSGEEFGFIGSMLIIMLFIFIFIRCLMISIQAQDNFTRLLSGSLGFTFITSALVNLGMVVGLVPVVGVPLPLISYGGSSFITLMISFGIMMSMHTHRRLWSS